MSKFKVGETSFTKENFIFALKQFIEYGENTFGITHHGYFSGNGWAARCLKYHIHKLEQQGELEHE